MYLEKACLAETEGIIKQRAVASEFGGNSETATEEAQQEEPTLQTPTASLLHMA